MPQAFRNYCVSEIVFGNQELIGAKVRNNPKSGTG